MRKSIDLRADRRRVSDDPCSTLCQAERAGDATTSARGLPHPESTRELPPDRVGGSLEKRRSTTVIRDGGPSPMLQPEAWGKDRTMDVRYWLTMAVAIVGGVAIGLVIAAAIIDHSTFVATARARATVGRRR